ncbi:MAG: 30S ribosomal protein S8 [Solirubrobacteraceae bacterium]
MSMTDPIADFLTRLRNGAKAQHHDVTIPSSKLKRELARILKEQGYIEGYELLPTSADHPGERIVVTLKYTNDRKPVISGIRRISRPGQRTYVDHAHLPKVQGGLGTAIISTSRGVMTGHEARALGVGGEVVAQVW